jgi:Increased loss of mitochondrial DNA protein 1
MPLLSSALLLRTHALTLLTTSYFLLTSPLTILQSAPIWILGEAMHLRPALFQPSPNPLTNKPVPLDEEANEILAVLALAIVVFGIGEIVFAGGLSVPEGLSKAGSGSRSVTAGSQGSKARRGEELHTLLSMQSTHLNLAFIHIAVSGVLVAWVYLFHSSRNILTGDRVSVPGVQGSLGQLLGNQVVFSVALMDMLFWGYVWTVIREERREVLGRVGEMRSEDED